jgi:hypothetical protein
MKQYTTNSTRRRQAYNANRAYFTPEAAISRLQASQREWEAIREKHEACEDGEGVSKCDFEIQRCERGIAYYRQVIQKQETVTP